MDVLINKAEWEALDDATRKKITAIIGGNFKGSRIVPDTNGQSFANTNVIPLNNPFCEAACNIAENVAKTACFGLSNPIAIAACIALAEAGGRECRNRC